MSRIIAVLVLGLLLPAATRADVAPGDRITAGNAEKLKGLIPEEVYRHTIHRFRDLDMEIVPTADYRPHPSYREATVKFACQASLDERGVLVNYVAGQPFPYSRWAQEATDHRCDLQPDDPHFGLKLAWNANHRWNAGTMDTPHWAQSYWRDEGDRTWKIARGHYRRTYFSHRADLLPDTTHLGPDQGVEWAEYSETLTPFDLRGTAFLVFRYRDSHQRADDAWAYIPSLRRSTRLSTEEKADSLQGSNSTLEDFGGFSGYVWDQDWDVHREEEVLAPMNSRRRCYPFVSEELRAQGVKPESDAAFFGCRFGPYRALPFVDETWEQREAIVLRQIPKRSDHPYSSKLIWYDRETFQTLFWLSYDRDNTPFRLYYYITQWSETSENPANHGRFLPIFVGGGVVNLQTLTSNVFLDWSSTAVPLGPQEATRYYDTSRLKQKH